MKRVDITIRIKESIFIFMIVFFGIQAFAKETHDTVSQHKKVESLVILKEGNKTIIETGIKNANGSSTKEYYNIEISDSNVNNSKMNENWEFELPFFTVKTHKNISKHTEIKRIFMGFQHVYFGWQFNYHHKDNVKNSFEFGVRNLIGMGWKRGNNGPSLGFGLGIGMRRFAAREGFCYFGAGNQLLLIPAEEGIQLKSSRLDLLVFHVPLFLEIPLVNKLSFTIGGLINFNTWASAKTVTINEGNKFSSTYKNLQQNIFNVDVYASLNYSCIGFYADWSPMPIFKNGYGPEARSISIGVTFFP